VFQSTAIRRPEGGFQLIGRLRIKDRVQTVTIAAASLGDRATERSERRGFEGSLTVLRKDFGVVNEGNILERMGVIGKDVEIEIQLSALRLKPEGRAYRDREEARSVGAVLEEVLDAEGIDAAVARYRTALEDDGHSLEMGLPELVTLGSRLVLEGRAGNAAPILAAYVAHHPSDAEGRFWLGEMLAESGERDAALASYRMALDLDPLRADAAERIRYLTNSRQRAFLIAGSEPR
jgi:tetratricopeptide (TPR) repeat protein